MAGQVWATSAEGAYMYSDELSAILRTALQPMAKLRQFCDARDATEKGLHRGDQYNWNIYSDVATQGGSIAETQKMPETNFTITQNSLTITEYGNSISFSKKLDDLSLQPVKEIIHKVLKNDATKALEGAVWDQFDSCDKRFAPTSGTSTTAITVTGSGTTATTNNVALGIGHIKAIADEMKEADVPAYIGDDYVALSHPSTLRPVYNSLEAIHQYVDPGWGHIMRGERGRYDAVRFVEQTYIPKGGAINATTFNVATQTAEAWTNAKSSWMFVMGADTVAEAIAIPVELRGKIPGDYQSVTLH